MKTVLKATAKLVLTIVLTGAALIHYSQVASAIVGGAEATNGEQPWMVGIGLANESNTYYAQFCGGTVISERWILTAAHCTLDEENTPFEATEIDIIMGHTDLNAKVGKRIAVSRIIRHAGFDLMTYNNDIALLQLGESLDIAPIRLADSQLAGVQLFGKKEPTTVKQLLERSISTTTGDNKSTLNRSIYMTPNDRVGTAHSKTEAKLGGAQVFMEATVYGWGITEAGSGATVLQKASLPVVSKDRCQNAYTSYGITVTDNMMCAGFTVGGADSCVGDSGGPLVSFTAAGDAVQLGLVSWGLECGGAGLFGVYTNVSQYGQWVKFQLSFYQ